MYVRPLRYGKPANEQMLSILNYTNQTDIESWQVTFGTPYLVPEDKPQIEVRHLNDYNNHRPAPAGTLTGIEVIPTPASGWKDTLQLTYRRSVIQDLFISVPFVIYSTSIDHQVILNALYEQYGLYLDLDLVDFEFLPANLADVLLRSHMGSIIDSDNYADFVRPIAHNVIIRMKPEHPIYVGEIYVYIREAVRFLDRDVKTTLAVRRYMADNNQSKIPAELMLPNNRSVDHDHVLRNLKPGDLAAEWIVNTAKAITGDQWVFTPEQSAFNLYGTKVVYNGLNTGDVYINDPKVSNVLIVEFSEDHCSNIRGQWVIGYYNRDSWLRRERIDHLPLQDQ